MTNETLAPLQIELKSFEQTSDVLNDVLPEAHESWEGLNKKESKDIALALVPTPSDGWLSLNESPCYKVSARKPRGLAPWMNRTFYYDFVKFSVYSNKNMI